MAIEKHQRTRPLTWVSKRIAKSLGIAWGWYVISELIGRLDHTGNEEVRLKQENYKPTNAAMRADVLPCGTHISHRWFRNVESYKELTYNRYLQLKLLRYAASRSLRSASVPISTNGARIHEHTKVMSPRKRRKMQGIVTSSKQARNQAAARIELLPDSIGESDNPGGTTCNIFNTRKHVTKMSHNVWRKVKALFKHDRKLNCSDAQCDNRNCGEKRRHKYDTHESRASKKTRFSNVIEMAIQSRDMHKYLNSSPSQVGEHHASKLKVQ